MLSGSLLQQNTRPEVGG